MSHKFFTESPHTQLLLSRWLVLEQLNYKNIFHNYNTNREEENNCNCWMRGCGLTLLLKDVYNGTNCIKTNSSLETGLKNLAETIITSRLIWTLFH